MTTQVAALAAVRATGRRITAQRQTVLDVIESATEHLDAESILRKAKAQDPRISLATVYRTLELLHQLGLVEQNYITRSHDRERYEPVGAPQHYHFVCLDCGRVIEFRSPGIARAIARFEADTGAQVSRACVCLEGYCRECSAKRQSARD